MINSIKKLTVSYNGKIVGFLAETKNNEIAFQYDEDWITSGFSISPFSLPLDNRIYICKNVSKLPMRQLTSINQIVPHRFKRSWSPKV